MKKDLRKQIKQDELVTGFEKARAAVDSHLDELKIAGLVLVVLAVGALALRHFRGQRDRDAHEALAAALQTFRAPLPSEAAPDAPAPLAPSPFATEAEKYRKALGDFQGVERRYGSHPAAVRARYYGALCQIELTQYDEAEKALKELAAGREGNRLEPALARLAIADLQRRRGQIEQAVDTYKQIADDAAFGLPRDAALLSLAQLYEEAKRPADARAAYRQLIDMFPESAYVTEARRRVEFLQARG